ncbi:MAG: HEAT repeat domain-containing protein [Planctomycetota bacterium]|nr:HEAT repeat domain-containing protein [Planctomycetota bacterium]
MARVASTPLLALAMLCGVAALSGCLPSESVSLQARDPVKRMEAIVDAAEEHDRSQIPGLVKLLDSDDPATRMLAIRSLEEITGETHGYDHAAPRLQRDKAVDEWVAAVESGKYGQLSPVARDERRSRSSQP